MHRCDIVPCTVFYRCFEFHVTVCANSEQFLQEYLLEFLVYRFDTAYRIFDIQTEHKRCNARSIFL